MQIIRGGPLDYQVPGTRQDGKLELAVRPAHTELLQAGAAEEHVQVVASEWIVTAPEELDRGPADRLAGWRLRDPPLNRDATPERQVHSLLVGASLGPGKGLAAEKIRLARGGVCQHRDELAHRGNDPVSALVVGTAFHGM